MGTDHSTDAERSTTGFAAYRELLRAPGARSLALASALGRLPNGMVGLGLILFLHERTGSFGSAGLVTGGWVLGLGLTGPVLARLIDRLGSRPVIVAGGLASAVALALVVVLGRAGAGAGVLAAMTVLVGGAMPPIGGVVRRRWGDLVPATSLPTAYAVDGVMLESIFIAGPALTGLLATLFGAGDALLVAAVVGAVGAVWFSTLVHFPPRDAAAAAERHWAGALRSPVVRLLVATGLAMGAGIAGVELALPAFGAAHGNAALGGPLSATLALGSLLGGLAYGARADAFGSPPRALVALGTLQGLSAAPMLLVGGKAEMFAAAALAGLCWAPLNTVRTRLIQARVEAATVIEAFTWDGLSETLGAGISTALAGPLVASQGWRAAVLVACALPLAGGLIAFLGRAVTAPGLPGTTPAR
ncbi:MAG: MFS transporter [Solirubrobacterales bacterium]